MILDLAHSFTMEVQGTLEFGLSTTVPGTHPTAPIDNSDLSASGLSSPALNSHSTSDNQVLMPTQLKLKINCDGSNSFTLVVATEVTYQTLIDRIDAKVGRFSSNSIAEGTMRLRYRDEDGDFVSIVSDDDIQLAFKEWWEAYKPQYHSGRLAEIELFCVSVRI